MKPFILLLSLESKKLLRNTKSLLLPPLFYLLAFYIMLIFVPRAPGMDSVLRIFLWVLVSLSLKLSFGSFLHDDADKNLVQMLIAERYSIGPFIWIKVGISILIFSALFVAMFMAGVYLQILSLKDVQALPLFVTSLLVLQVGVELLTLKTKAARYLCYLLLLPLEIPLFILVLSQVSLSSTQLLETMGGLLLLYVGTLFFLSSFIF